MPVLAKKSCDHQPYVQHRCFGRYAEPGQSWSTSRRACSEQCDLRFNCRAKSQLSPRGEKS